MAASTTSVVLDDEELQRIYTWVDEIPLSRPKRNITRDFSDGVLLAEVTRHYFPKLVEMHNYSSANSARQKMYNWATLNQKVFRRLSFPLDKSEIDAISSCKPGAVEVLLLRLQRHIMEVRAGKRALNASGGAPSPTRGGGIEGLVQGEVGQSGGGGYTTTRGAGASMGGGADTSALLSARDATISELTETIEMLELKVKKLEQLVRLKDSRIQTLTTRLGGAVM